MTLEMKYIGAVALLGRISHNFRDDEKTLYCIKHAMDDLVEELPGRFEVVKTSGGYSLEPISQP